MVLNRVTQIIKGFPETCGEDVDDFLEWVNLVSKKGEKIVFRGQRKNWQLLPSISRNKINKSSFLKVEKQLLETFKKEALPCLHRKPKTDWDWLVVGQHHGLPTRVLDWSNDPLVALYFALEKYDLEDSLPEVWALRLNKEDIINSLTKAKPFRGTRSKLFETDFTIPRVTQQKGCFILFKYIDKKGMGFVPLEQNRYLKGKIEKIRGFQRLAQGIRQQLEKKGYFRRKLFPDIDEVAKDVTQKVLNKIA